MSEHSKASRNAGLSPLPPVPLDGFGRSPTSSEQGDKHPGTKRAHDSDRSHVPRHRFLSPTEWAIFARGVGATRDTEHNTPVHSVSWWWPPRGLPPGLYRDVIHRRTISFYFFHVASIIRWGLMIVQLFLGATLTALGALSMQDGTSITILGAANTIIAGLLALLHNSGLPDRYRYDMAEFEEVEDHIRELLTTGLVRADKSLDQVLAECYDLYHDAKATVAANMPVTYTPSQTLQAGRSSIPMGAPGTVTPPKLPRANSEDDKSPTAKPGK
ncbi:hypothetical protein ACJ41O_007978 [Fusarium nematophilum]